MDLSTSLTLGPPLFVVYYGERGKREGKVTEGLSLSSGTHRIHNSLVIQTDCLWLSSENRGTCVCVCEWGSWVWGGCGYSCHSGNTYTCRLTCGVWVYYESLKRDLKTKPINECRCDERLKIRVEESTRLTCPRLVKNLNCSPNVSLVACLFIMNR